MLEQLNYREQLRLDADRLGTLYYQLGAIGAEDMVCRAMEELAVRMAELQRLEVAGKTDEMRKLVRNIAAISEQIGMQGVARAARHVGTCLTDGDPVALAATLARLHRVSDRSMLEIWDCEDITSV